MSVFRTCFVDPVRGMPNPLTIIVLINDYNKSNGRVRQKRRHSCSFINSLLFPRVFLGRTIQAKDTPNPHICIWIRILLLRLFRFSSIWSGGRESGRFICSTKLELGNFERGEKRKEKKDGCPRKSQGCMHLSNSLMYLIVGLLFHILVVLLIYRC